MRGPTGTRRSEQQSSRQGGTARQLSAIQLRDPWEMRSVNSDGAGTVLSGRESVTRNFRMTTRPETEEGVVCATEQVEGVLPRASEYYPAERRRLVGLQIAGSECLCSAIAGTLPLGCNSAECGGAQGGASCIGSSRRVGACTHIRRR